MAIEKKEIDFAKELGDVMALLTEIVKHFKAGKKPAELPELLDELVTAVTGIDQLDDELKENQKAAIATVLLGANDIVDIFLKKEA